MESDPYSVRTISFKRIPILTIISCFMSIFMETMEKDWAHRIKRVGQDWFQSYYSRERSILCNFVRKIQTRTWYRVNIDLIRGINQAFPPILLLISKNGDFVMHSAKYIKFVAG